MSGPKAVIRQVGEGERLWFAGGGLFTMKLSSADTGGAFLCLEDEVVRGKTTPYHLHPDEDETIYVLEGELLAYFDGEEHVVGERGVFFAPRGLPHAFLVTSERARLLVWQTPGSGEPFYRSASDPSASEADADRPPDIERLTRAAASSPAIEILGPPPFRQAAAGAGAAS